jgi:hypothetical protein
MKYIKRFNENNSERGLNTDYIIAVFKPLMDESSNYDRGSRVSTGGGIFNVGDPRYPHMNIYISRELEGKVALCMDQLKEKYPTYACEIVDGDYENIISVRVFDERDVEEIKSKYGSTIISKEDLEKNPLGGDNGLSDAINKGIQPFINNSKSNGEPEVKKEVKKEYKDMTPEELDVELKNALEEEDYDLAIYLRDNFLKKESRLEWTIKMNKIFESKKLKNKYIKTFEKYNSK